MIQHIFKEIKSHNVVLFWPVSFHQHLNSLRIVTVVALLLCFTVVTLLLCVTVVALLLCVTVVMLLLCVTVVTLLLCVTVVALLLCVTVVALPLYRRRRKLYFNNLLHVHQHTSMKYMIYDTVGYWGKKIRRQICLYAIFPYKYSYLLIHINEHINTNIFMIVIMQFNNIFWT